MSTKFKLTLDEQVISASEITEELIVNSLFEIENDDRSFMILEPSNPTKNSISFR